MGECLVISFESSEECKILESIDRVNGHLIHTPFSPLKRGDGGVSPSDMALNLIQGIQGGLHKKILFQRSPFMNKLLC
ncbi:MAG: hypothetical protein A3I59_01215 [Planctomycetes bacterium RIFCSPLOWO2_02_FULL_50_16]|nr:MAG: hypothetical protein A3I59_01215 [Planctomycetes bacterium RIFCSPLOWO2_02_FULL_50_16]